MSTAPIIREIRILPPLAIGRVGSAESPLDNFFVDLDIDPQSRNPLDFRSIKNAPTLQIDDVTGEITRQRISTEKIKFRDGQHIRPVAPFLEVFAVLDDGSLTPLTVELLQQAGVEPDNIGWRIKVSNRKVERRTRSSDDRVTAVIPETQNNISWTAFSAARPTAPDYVFGPGVHALEGRCANFLPDSKIDFGAIRMIRPNNAFPEIRFRFTPAKGLIYGPKTPERRADAASREKGPYVVPPEQQVYDAEKGGWDGFEAPDEKSRGKKITPDSPVGAIFYETVPPSLFAIYPPAPPWLNDDIAVSRGYLDDICDGFIEVWIKVPSGDLTATARICSAPPAFAPDSLFVRNLVDDLEQIALGPEIAEAPADDSAESKAERKALAEDILYRAQDILRRAYETVRFMNVAVMNGNDVNGRPSIALDSMPAEEAATTDRPIRPVMPPATADTFAIMALHQQVFAALSTGATPWFSRLLRRPDEAGDFSDRGRRKMPALMCGADNNYLALTWRQINTIQKAEHIAAQSDIVPKRRPRNVTALKSDLMSQINHEALGNPISSRPITAVANCCPGLEVDFRAVWRRLFRGLLLSEHNNLVVGVEREEGLDISDDLIGHRLLRIHPPGDGVGISVIGKLIGPSSLDIGGSDALTSGENPQGVAPLEWSNALARVMATCQGKKVRCVFSSAKSPERQVGEEAAESGISVNLEVRKFFEGDTAVISRALADAGELTQGLCSPWQNDFRECSCYYWASARPDFVNVAPGPNGMSAGDNWMQRDRTGSYVPDDYADSRLILYDELFRDWERRLDFQVGGKDYQRVDVDSQRSAKKDES